MRHIELFCERLQITVEGDLSGPVRWQFTGEAEQSLEGDALTAWLKDRGDKASNPARTFIEAAASGAPATPCFRDALPAHRIVDAIYRSAAADGELVRDAEGPR
jgi:predicted dehydrogenase